MSAPPRVIDPSSDPAEIEIHGPFESVWDAIEDDPAERQRLEVLSSLMIMLEEHIKAQGWTQKAAAKQLGVTQPRISDLKRGKMDLFSIDSIVAMLGAAGLKLEIQVRDAT